MSHKTLPSYFLQCLIWVVVVVRGRIDSRNSQDTFKAGFDEMLGNIQAEGKQFVIKKSL